MPGILPHLLCAAAYASIAAALLRSLTDAAADPAHHSQRLRLLHLLTVAPLALHAWLLHASVFSAGGIYPGGIYPPGIYLGVGVSVSVIIWLAALIYWIGGFFYRLEGLQVFILAAAAGLVLMPLALPSIKPLTHTDLPAFRVHLTIALSAFSLFTIASLQALTMAVLERRLREGPLPAFLQSLPPLLTMERLLFRIIAVGFVLLTLTLASGMLFSEELFGQPLRFTHKVVFAVAAWFIFAALLAGRSIYGWRGRVALRWTLAGFMVLVLAYIGTKFVLEILLHR
jgi:ABC-type uncharacterized transport system permease subunit